MTDNAIAIALFTLMFSATCYGLLAGARAVRRLTRRRAVNRMVRQQLTEWEQRRRAWAVQDGDGIRPPRPRF